MSNIPLRLSASPWVDEDSYHPYWSQWVDIFIDNERVVNVLQADSGPDGFIEAAITPVRIVDGAVQTYRLRGHVRFEARADRPPETAP